MHTPNYGITFTTMITLEQLKQLADSIEVKAKEARDKGQLGEAVGFATSCTEIWRFILNNQNPN